MSVAHVYPPTAEHDPPDDGPPLDDGDDVGDANGTKVGDGFISLFPKGDGGSFGDGVTGFGEEGLALPPDDKEDVACVHTTYI